MKAKLIINKHNSEWYSEKESFIEFLAIEQVEATFTFIPSESYSVGATIDLETFQQYKINFEKKNPNYILKE